MIKRRTIGPATLYLGDSLQVLQELQDPVDGLVTDPPYSSGGLMRGDRMQAPLSKYIQEGPDQHAAHNVDFTGDNRDARSWAFWVSHWMTLALGRVRTGGYAMVFSDWRQLPSLTDAFQAGGFVWRGLIPWDKTESSRAPHKGYFRHQCEYVVWGTNGPLKPAKHGGPWPGLVRERVDHREKHHMTGKPLGVMDSLVQAVPSGSMILDPFMGSGSTGIAAIRRGQRFIGIEQSPHYFEVACNRVEAELSATMAAT